MGRAAQVLRGTAAERAGLPRRPEGGGVRQQPGQQVLAAGLQPVQPAEVVQPVVAHAVEPSVRQRRRRPRAPPGAPARPPNRRSRSPCRPSTGTRASVTMPAGLVKLISQASGQCSPHLPGQVQHPGDGPQGVGDAAGARGFLAEQAQVLGHAFVGDPAGRAAGADRREHHVRTRRGPSGRDVVVATAGAVGAAGAPPSDSGDGAQNRSDGGEAGGVDVEQHQFADQPREGAGRRAPGTQAAPGIRRRRQS